MDAGPIFAILIMVGCGCLWGYLIALRGRSVGSRIGFGIMGALLWVPIGLSIDRPVYRWMRWMLGHGHEDWEAVLGVYIVAAIIILVLGVIITQLIPRGTVVPMDYYVVKKPDGSVLQMSREDIVIGWNRGQINRDVLVQQDGECNAVPVPVFLGIEKPQPSTTP